VRNNGVLTCDSADQELLILALKKLEILNQIISLPNGKKALEYLLQNEISPFFIISDVEMPAENGFDFRKSILSDNTLRRMNISFVFYTSSSSEKSLNKAIKLETQGYFIKQSSMKDLQHIILQIIDSISFKN
jgi:DNA-binding NarL/FixJ family response regulator